MSTAFHSCFSVIPWRMPSAFKNSDDNNQIFKLDIQATAGNSVAKYSSDENKLKSSNNNKSIGGNKMDGYEIANVKALYPQGTAALSALLSTSYSVLASEASSLSLITPTITTATTNITALENMIQKPNVNDEVINQLMSEIENIELNANDLKKTETVGAESSKNSTMHIADDDSLSNNNNNNEITKLIYNNNDDTTTTSSSSTTTVIKEKGAGGSAISNNLNITCEQGNNPLKQIIITIEHKIRNLEKRKTKLESYREIQTSGKDLSSDQKLAVAKFDAVASTLDFARSLSKQIVQISKEAEKEQKKQSRKDVVAKSQAETAKIRELLILQRTVDLLKKESVLDAFRKGSYGAIKLEPSDINAIERFLADVNINGQESSTDLQNAQKCAELYSMTIDGRPKPYYENVTYEKLHEIFEKIQQCGYLEKVQKLGIKSKQQHADIKTEQNQQHHVEQQQQQHLMIEQQQQQKITPQAPPAAVLPVFQGQNIQNSMSPVYNSVTGHLFTCNENTVQNKNNNNDVGGNKIQTPSQAQNETHKFDGQTPTNVHSVEQSYFKQHFMQQMRPLDEVLGNGNFYFLQDNEVDSPDMGIPLCGNNNMQNNMATSSPLSAIFIEQQIADNNNVVQQQQQQSLISTQTFNNHPFPQIQPQHLVINKSPTSTAGEHQQQQHALFSPVSSVNSQQSVTSTKSQQQASLAKDMQTTIVGANNSINVAGNNNNTNNNKSSQKQITNEQIVMGVMHTNNNDVVGSGVGVPAIVPLSNVVYAFDSPNLYMPQLEQQNLHHHHQLIESSAIEQPLLLTDKITSSAEIIAALSQKDVVEPTVPVNAWNSPLNSALNLTTNIKVNSNSNSLGVVVDGNNRHNANRNNNKWSSSNLTNEWPSATTKTTTPSSTTAAAAVGATASTAGAFADNSDVNHWNTTATVNTAQQQSQIDNINVVTVGNYGRGNGRSGSNHRRNDERNPRNGGNGGYRNRNNYGNSITQNTSNANGGSSTSTISGSMSEGVNNNSNNGGGNRNASGVFFRNNENTIGSSASSFFQNGTNNTNIYGSGNAIKETSRFHNDYRSGSRSGGANNGGRTGNNSNNNSATRSLLRGGNNNNNNNNHHNNSGGGTNNNNNTNTSSGAGTAGGIAYIPTRSSYRIP